MIKISHPTFAGLTLGLLLRNGGGEEINRVGAVGKLLVYLHRGSNDGNIFYKPKRICPTTYLFLN